MSGKAEVTFTCGALIYEGEAVQPDYPCDTAITVPLLNDGQYTNFNIPQDWHIDLGVWDVEGTIVRCPEHCRWVVKEFEVNFDGWGRPSAPRMVKEGHWEDL